MLHSLTTKKNSFIIDGQIEVQKGSAQVVYDGDRALINTQEHVLGKQSWEMSWKESEGNGVPFKSLKDMQDFISANLFSEMTSGQMPDMSESQQAITDEIASNKASIDQLSNRFPSAKGQHSKDDSLSVTLTPDQVPLEVEVVNFPQGPQQVTLPGLIQVEVTNPVEEVTVANQPTKIAIDGPVTVSNPVTEVSIKNPTTEVTVKNPVNTVAVGNTGANPVPVTVQNPTTGVTINNANGSPVPVNVQNQPVSQTINNTSANPVPVNVQNQVTSISINNAAGSPVPVTIQNPQSNVGISGQVTLAKPAVGTGYDNVFSILSVSGTNRRNIKASAALVGHVDVQAPGITLGYVWVKLYNKATAPTTADVPLVKYAVAAGVNNLPRSIDRGLNFPLGLGIAITTNAGDSDDTPVALSAVSVNIFYQ